MNTRLSSPLAWLVSAVLFGCASFFDAPGDGGGGGAAGGETPAGGGAPAAGGGDDHGDTTAAGGAEDGAGDTRALADDDTDDDRFPDHDDIDTLPEANVRTRLRRTSRFAQRVRPIADRFRRQDGKLMSADEVDAILSGHREFQTIDSVLKRSPKAVQFLLEEQRRLEQGGGDDAAAGGAEDAPFNEADWPFETETPQGKALLSLGKRQHDQELLIKRLTGELGGVRTGIERQTVGQLEKEWKSVAFQAASEIDQPYRPMFIRNVRREFQRLQASGQLTRANAKQVVDAELTEIRAAKKSTQRGNVTRQSEVVAGNRTLPRTPRPGTTTPASGKPNGGKRETMKDASAGFLSRYR